MSDPDVTAEQRKRREQERAHRYRQLEGFRDRDALHEALARDPRLWDKDAPIVVAAARYQELDERRRTARRSRLTAKASADPPPLHAWDPLALVLAREEFTELRSALAELDRQDLLVLWLHAAGHSDRDIATTWDALELKPSSPSLASIRKRRERVRAHLRERLRPDKE
jgi:hypothetical protein